MACQWNTETIQKQSSAKASFYNSEVQFLLASLESVLSEWKGLTEEYSIKYDEANLGTIMLSYFSQISEALSGSDGCMSHSLIKQWLFREAIYAICQFKQYVVLWLSFTLNIDKHHISQD